MTTRIGSYSQIKGSIIKQPCIAATTNHINLTGATNIIDGVLLNVNDRVLVTSQSLSKYNGIYVVLTGGTGSNGVWERSLDFSLNDDLFTGLNVYIISGNTYSDSYFILETSNPIIIDTTPIYFTNRKNLNIQNIDNTQILFYSNSITGDTQFTYDKIKHYMSLGKLGITSY